MDPRKCSLGSHSEFEEVQGKIFPFDPELEMEWAPARSLKTGETKYVPASMVYVPYRFPQRSHILMRPISTGLAAGRTRDQATLAGLLEIIERDSLGITWLNRLPVPTLDLSTLPPGPARDLWARLTSGGIDITCKLTTTDLGIPAVLLSTREWKRDDTVLVAHSARANLDLVSCIKSALEELEQSRSAIRDWIDTRGVPTEDAVLREIEDYFCYYSSPERLAMLDFFRDGQILPVPEVDPGRATGDNGQQVSRIVAALDERGYEALAVDITPIDVAECGLSVIRAIVPGLQPISFNQKFRHLGGRRLYEAPVKMGIRSTPLREDELNANPIPAG